MPHVVGNFSSWPKVYVWYFKLDRRQLKRPYPSRSPNGKLSNPHQTWWAANALGSLSRWRSQGSLTHHALKLSSITTSVSSIHQMPLTEALLRCLCWEGQVWEGTLKTLFLYSDSEYFWVLRTFPLLALFPLPPTCALAPRSIKFQRPFFGAPSAVRQFPMCELINLLHLTSPGAVLWGKMDSGGVGDFSSSAAYTIRIGDWKLDWYLFIGSLS